MAGPGRRTSSHDLGSPVEVFVCSAPGPWSKLELPRRDVRGAPGAPTGADLHRGGQPAIPDAPPGGCSTDAAKEGAGFLPAEIVLRTFRHRLPARFTRLQSSSVGPEAISSRTGFARVRQYVTLRPSREAGGACAPAVDLKGEERRGPGRRPRVGDGGAGFGRAGFPSF
jgi:hypothetical protein